MIKTMMICLLASTVFLYSCGGGSDSSRFRLNIDGVWRGSLKQAGSIICRDSDGSTFSITAGVGAFLREGTFNILGGQSENGEVIVEQLVDQDTNCTLTGLRVSETGLEVFPDRANCSNEFLDSVEFVFSSSMEAEVVENYVVPDHHNLETGFPLCSADTFGSLVRDEST